MDVIDQVKVPPHSVEAEQSVLGGLMLDNKTWDRIADRITEQDFYLANNRLIFQAISDLARHDAPFDVITIAERLRSLNRLDEAGGEVYLFDLANKTPSAANITAYADIVRERSIFRQLISIAGEIAGDAFQAQGRPSHELLDEAERRIFAIAEQKRRGDGPIRITELLSRTIERIDVLYHSNEALTGVETGFSDLDNMTSGLQPGDLVIVAGRPSMGKTSFAMNMGEHVAMLAATGKVPPVLVFSMEMSGEQLAMRMLSSLGRIDQHKVRTGKLDDEDWARLTGTVTLLSEAKLYIDDTPALSPTDLRARARRVAREHNGLGLIIVDYLQLMQVPGFKENRTMEITEISRALKALAKELRVPIVALSQLNRSLEQRQDRRPVMSDLRESGSIEQDADLILFIYRDEVYHEDTPDKGIAEIIIAKQRNGPTGKIKLTFNGQFTRFDNHASDEYVTAASVGAH